MFIFYRNLWKFYILKNLVYEPWRSVFLLFSFHIEQNENLYFNQQHTQKVKMEEHFTIVKTLVKFIWPANENYTIFHKKQVYELWRSVFPTFILKGVKVFAVINIICKRYSQDTTSP